MYDFVFSCLAAVAERKRRRPATGHHPYEIQRRQKRDEESPAKNRQGKEAGKAGEKGQALITDRARSVRRHVVGPRA